MLYYHPWKPKNPDNPGSLVDRLYAARRAFNKTQKAEPTGFLINAFEDESLSDDDLDDIEAMGLDVTWTIDIDAPNIGLVP